MKPRKLGKASPYPVSYDKTLLETVERESSRDLINFKAAEFNGSDLWTCYEFSWLSENQVPQRAILTLEYDMHSRSIVESKSLKYYLFSLSNSIFLSINDIQTKLYEDLSETLANDVKISLVNDKSIINNSNKFESIDHLNININRFIYDPNLLEKQEIQTRQIVTSSLLRSNCPITGQPDWASVFIVIDGEYGLTNESLLRYIVSFREQQEFHEQCVERIISDIKNVCEPSSLTVYARYSRRGGIDINPLRYCGEISPEIEELITLNRQLIAIDRFQ